MAENSSLIRRSQQFVESLPELKDSFQQCILRIWIDLLVRKIDVRFHVCQDGQKQFANLGYFATEMASELFVCSAQSQLRLRTDQIHDRFRLSQIKFAVQKRPLREFSGIGHPGSRIQHQVQYT